MYKYTIIDKEHITVTNLGYPTLTISKIAKGRKFYAEPNSAIAFSPVYDPDTGIGSLKRYCITEGEKNGNSDPGPVRHTRLGKFFQGEKMAIRETIERKVIGEQPMYVVYEALEKDQKITFKSCFPGTILPWKVNSLAQGETYDFKSIWSTRIDERPHGPLNAVKGSFLTADFNVLTKPYYQTGNNERDVLVKNFSGTNNVFQQFTGEGYVFLEVHGDLQEIPLFPRESVDIFPDQLLAFTDGVILNMVIAGDLRLRNLENNQYVIRLTAPEKGGFVYISSVSHQDFVSVSKV